jgi:ABC-2 type transport system ATP-binding protein
MEEVCFIADVGILPRWLKVANAIDYIEGVHPKFSRQKALELLGQTKIDLNKKIGQLSKGMVTQLHLSLILAIDVKLLVLDEPTLGLDILYQKAFFDNLLNDYFDHETSIIISTHQVEAVTSILTHLMFIDDGKINLDMPMDKLDETYAQVLVPPEKYQMAESLSPIHVRNMLGAKAMLFENAERTELEKLGEIHTPSVTDLFIAKIHQSREIQQ